ncbi:hypothetical protein TNIN_458781 [Trichonephila inaurata madagascariensis]|uniref:T20D4.11-like domain-containing protein n=1 Tax=Trichonephila inaurata madagascariensis TaxID=2747483 RepID=A0A8X7C4L0_9ARAC|nr:hypothetical protein TNIN_458781 [Trichonephila inaurata madagascariensis]
MENTHRRLSGKRPKKSRFRENQFMKVCLHTNVAERRNTAFAHAQDAQNAQNLEEECAEKAGECLGNLLTAVFGDNNEEVCSELRKMTSCLQEVADKCLGEEKDDKLDKDLREMNNLIAENCPAVTEVDNGVNECVDKIEDEIAECLVEGISEALSSILESPNELDADSIKCSMYNSVANCIINQIRTNCRIEASNKSLKAVLNIPDDIQESCNEPATNDVIQALFDRRKK